MKNNEALILKKSLSEFDYIVLTGASSGIGEQFLKMFEAHSNAKIFTISRRPSATDCPRVESVLCDLSESRDLTLAAEKILCEIPPNSKVLLVNNAGFGAYGEFPEPSLERNLSMIDLNVRSLTHLCGIFLPIIKAGRGGVINISSTAAWQACPQLSVYAATKAYVKSFTLALAQELSEFDCRCLCVCPGPTSSNFFRAAGFQTPPLPSGFGHRAEEVARASLLAFARGKQLKTVGFFNTLQTIAVRFVPTVFLSKISSAILKKIRAK